MIRSRFPIFAQNIFINRCSKGALAVDVRQTYQDYLDG